MGQPTAGIVDIEPMTFERAASIVTDIRTAPYRIEVGWVVPGYPAWWLQATLERADADTGERGVGRGGKYLFEPDISEDQLVQKALSAVLAYGEHEIREGFWYRNRRPFYPHQDIRTMGVEA